MGALKYKVIIRKPIWNEDVSRENYIQSVIQLLDYEQLDALYLTKKDIPFIKKMLSSSDPLVRVLSRILIKYISYFERDDREFLRYFLYGFLEELKELKDRELILDDYSFLENYGKIKRIFEKYNVNTEPLEEEKNRILKKPKESVIIIKKVS